MSKQDYEESQRKFLEYQLSLQQPITITPQEVADRLHEEIYHNGQPHSIVHSCPCYNLALFYLGVTESHGLYWPDGKGGNAWDKRQPSKANNEA